jgi:hypothetical protein
MPGTISRYHRNGLCVARRPRNSRASTDRDARAMARVGIS